MKCKHYTKTHCICLSVQEEGFSQPCSPPTAAIAPENLRSHCVRAGSAVEQQNSVLLLQRWGAGACIARDGNRLSLKPKMRLSPSVKKQLISFSKLPQLLESPT